MSTTELRGCPFCGGEAAFATAKYTEQTIKTNGWTQGTFYFVSCIICGSSTQGLVGQEDREQAAKKWNQRA